MCQKGLQGRHMRMDTLLQCCGDLCTANGMLPTWQQAIQPNFNGQLLQTQGGRQDEVPQRERLSPAGPVPLKITCAEAHVRAAEVVNISPALER